MSLHTLKVAGLERNLPKIQINDELAIASFVMLGDTELIERCAEHLSVHPDFPKGEIDFLVCPEAKAIPLTHALARLLDIDYVVARKSVKGYMVEPMIEKVQSITTIGAQTLVLDRCDVLMLTNKNVFIIDDVVSTGGSLAGLEKLLSNIDCKVVGKGAVLLEDAGYENDELIYLEKLPIFSTK